MVKSARLNRNTFLSLKEEPGATSQALFVLALSGASFGIGFTASIGFNLLGILVGAILGMLASLVLGFLWLSLTFVIGTKVFRGTSGYWSLARPLFFATSPGLVFLIMSIPVPVVSEIARAIGVAWIAIATVISVKTALGLDNQRSLLIFIMVTVILAISFGLVASL